MEASSIVSNAECAIICNSYLCFLLAPTPPTLPGVGAVEVALLRADPVAVGIRERRLPNIPPPPLAALSEEVLLGL